MSRLRTAVIGAGHLGRIHTRLAKTIDEIELIGVADPVEDARNRVAAEFETEAFADHSELIHRIDAAIVAAPTKLHHTIAADLLSAGVHCLVEKPITSTTQEADQLIDLARERGLVLQVGQVERFNPTLDVVRDNLGSPRYIEAARTSGYTFRSTDVGVVLDLMIHDIDIVLSMVQSELVDVRAIGSPIFGGFEDMAQARLEFADGCVANLTASRASFVVQRKIHVYAEDGYAGLDLANHSATLVKPSKEFAAGRIPFTNLSQPEMETMKEALFTDILQMQQVSVEGRNAILDEQNDFVQSVLTEKWPVVSGGDGRAALDVAERILYGISRQQQASEGKDGLSTLPHPQARPATPFSPAAAQPDRHRKAG